MFSRCSICRVGRVCGLFRSSVSLPGSTPTPPEERISPEVKDDTKFSVWVSFCEIYNENIHDLLEATPSGAPRRAALRLAQDANGNAYVKGDLGKRVCVCLFSGERCDVPGWFCVQICAGFR